MFSAVLRAAVRSSPYSRHGPLTPRTRKERDRKSQGSGAKTRIYSVRDVASSCVLCHDSQAVGQAPEAADALPLNALSCSVLRTYLRRNTTKYLRYEYPTKS
jgi:hypothetical protein